MRWSPAWFECSDSWSSEMKGEFIQCQSYDVFGIRKQALCWEQDTPSPSQSLPEWKRRPVCGCSTVSLAPEVLGCHSLKLCKLHSALVSSTKSTHAFGWSDLSSSPQTSPLACSFKITRERSMIYWLICFLYLKKKILLFIPGWTRTHNNHTASASWVRGYRYTPTTPQPGPYL